MERCLAGEAESVGTVEFSPILRPSMRVTLPVSPQDLAGRDRLVTSSSYVFSPDSAALHGPDPFGLASEAAFQEGASPKRLDEKTFSAETYAA